MAFSIYVLDTNAVIDLKRVVPLAEQWDLFQRLQILVETGHIAFPRQVTREMTVTDYPDAPGVWLVGGATRSMQHSEPTEESLVAVLRMAPEMIDPDIEVDRADPYVVAMAMELNDEPYFEVTVVSEDRIDRPGAVSVVTACRRIGLPCCGVDDFLAWVRSTGR